MKIDITIADIKLACKLLVGALLYCLAFYLWTDVVAALSLGVVLGGLSLLFAHLIRIRDEL